MSGPEQIKKFQTPGVITVGLDVEIAHRSCSICLPGDIAMRLGRKLRWDPDRDQFINDPDADKLLSKPMRSPWHL